MIGSKVCKGCNLFRGDETVFEGVPISGVQIKKSADLIGNIILQTNTFAFTFKGV